MNKKKLLKNIVLYSMIVVSIIITILFGYNIVQVLFVDSSVASGTVLEVDDVARIEELEYQRGNNPTDLQVEYFNALDDAVDAEAGSSEPYSIVEFVVKSFVSDYYTWTNKDGNYEVGGLTYIYGPMFTKFQTQARWEFYSDLDAYIEQFGRENLLEVDSIETSTVRKATDFTTYDGKVLPAYYVEAEWTYKPSTKINVNEFQQVGYFTLVDNNGRIEIAEFYDAWD